MKNIILLLTVFSLTLMLTGGCDSGDDGGEVKPGVAKPVPGEWAGTDISFTVNGDSTAITEIKWVFQTSFFTERQEAKGVFEIVDGAFSLSAYSPHADDNLCFLTGNFDGAEYANIEYRTGKYSRSYTAAPCE